MQYRHGQRQRVARRLHGARRDAREHHGAHAHRAARPLYLRELERRFPAFLDENLPRNPLKCEYFVPSVVDAQLRAGTADVTMLHTDDAWHGVTYHDDLPDVVAALRALRAAGKYPDNIW